jgi:hypothetical protein
MWGNTTMSRIGSNGIFLGISMDCWKSALFVSVFANLPSLGRLQLQPTCTLQISRTL